MADERLGASFSIDVSQLSAGLKQANRLIRESESEFKAAAAGMDNWSKSEDGLNAKIKSLSDITNLQKEKVKALKSEYSRLISEGMDPASTHAINLRTQINNQEAALAKNQKELQSNKQALSELGSESQKAGSEIEQSSSKFSGWGEAARAAGAVAAAALAAAGTAVVAIGKQALESYASYEQLVGGVDTLFKDSSSKVQQYAANAYQTAGLSANAYMEQATSFAASLIQSLGGDTEKAAEYANTAITDMSDNANKMGTDIQMLQNAYGGFAKQNYTMLDNLKLGYGGTKEEMERLLADAEKLPEAMGRKFDVSNYADIVDAIHLVQKNMDISGYSVDQLNTKIKDMSLSEAELGKVAESMGISTEEAYQKMAEGTLTAKDANVLLGTTAKEAATTIEGSVNAAKGAYTNLLTGLASDSADVGALIDNLISSVMTAIDNILPRVIIILQRIPEALAMILPQIPPLIEQLLPPLLEAATQVIESVVALLPTIIDAILAVLPQLLSALISMLPTILNAVIQIIISLINALSEMLPTIVQAIMEILPQLINALIAAIPQLIQAAIQFLLAIVQAIPTIILALQAALPQIIEAIIVALIQGIPIIIQGGIQLLMGLIEAIPTIIGALIAALPQIITTIVTTLIAHAPELLIGAIQLLLAIVQAIPQVVVQLAAAVPQLITTILNGLAEGITPITNIGRNLIEGLWNGINNAKEWILDKIRGFGEAVLNGLKDFFGIHSPAKLIEDEVGINIGLAAGTGMIKSLKKVMSMVDDFGSTITQGLSDSVSANISGVNVGVSGGMVNSNGGLNTGGVVVNQVNNYSQAHSRYELYKSKQQTQAAVRLAMGSV